MKLWSEGSKFPQKTHFLSYRKRRHDAQINPNHVTICLLRHSGESLQNGQLELRRRNWYFARETHKDTYQFEPVRQDFERVPEHRVSFEANPMQYSMGLATQMGMMQHSKKVSMFELYKFNPLSPHCRSIARELVHCYTWGRLRIVTVRGNTVGRHS